MPAPAISVIIPIYNTQSTLARCIDSVLNQTFTDLEIILVDDGTPDRAAAIADDYAARHKHIIVIHQPNRGLAEARRAGIHAAHGTYIVPLDSDDTLPPHAIELLHQRITADDLDMAYGAHRRIGHDGKALMAHHRTTGIMSGNEFLSREVLAPGSICGAWANISRRSLWTDDVFPPSDCRLPSEDVFMLVGLSERIRRIGLFDDVVYDYYYNPQSLTALGPLHRQDLWRRYFALVREKLHRQGLLESLEQQVRVMEVDRLAFYCPVIDTDDAWYKNVLAYDTSGFDLKHRILQRLLRHPRLLRAAIAIKRSILRN